MKKRMKSLFFGLLLGSGMSAHADCVALQPLAVMHDAYLALQTEGTRNTNAKAANQLLKYVPIYSARTFENAFSSMSMDVEIARLEKVLIDAFFLGRETLAGRKGALSDFHRQNARWLTGLISRTGCFTIKGSAQGGGVSTRREIGGALQSASEIPNKTSVTLISSRAILAALLLILTCAACYAIYHSRPLRIKRVERLPRHLVAFKAYATFKGANTSIIVLDISLGGAKIECDHPPSDREAITLILPCGAVPATIVWATAFYAGVMFDDQLTENDLRVVLEDDSITTRSKLSNIF